MIPEAKIAEIRERTDLVALVGEYVRLKRTGVSYKGLCPFHDERTPSFHVHPERNFYHCFGCQASGDAIGFLTNIEGLSFVEALERLADRLGMELPRERVDRDEVRRERELREQRYAILDAAAGFYIDFLNEAPEGAAARAELEQRGVDPEIAGSFRLGAAPSAWDALSSFLKERRLDLRVAEELGLIVKRRGGDGYYDRFRHRLLFPIVDLHGRIIAFSGRALPEEARRDGGDPPAKYINSPESPVYKKGEVLYGLFEGRLEARRQGEIIVCEGNFDVIALHQAGFRHAVAPMGTAFTETHARLIRRFAEQVTLLFDADDAGRKAVEAAHPILAKAGLRARVLSLPRGDDPDSFLRREGAPALTAQMEHARSIVDHLIELAAADAGSEPTAKSRAIASLHGVIRNIESPIEAQLYIERIARRFGVNDIQLVKRELRRASRGEIFERSAPARQDERAHVGPPYKPAAIEADLIGLLLDHPSLCEDSDASRLDELLTDDGLRSILSSIRTMRMSSGAIDGAALLESIEDSRVALWLKRRLAVSLTPQKGAEERLRVGILRLAKQQLEAQLQSLRLEIAKAREAANHELADQLIQTRALIASQVTQLAHELTSATSRGSSLISGNTTRQ